MLRTSLSPGSCLHPRHLRYSRPCEGRLIDPPISERMLIATRLVHFRKGMDGLAALVQDELRAGPARA